MGRKYRHAKSGAQVEVRDDKVMDSEWEPVGGQKAPAKKATARKAAAKSDEK